MQQNACTFRENTEGFDGPLGAQLLCRCHKLLAVECSQEGPGCIPLAQEHPQTGQSYC